MPAALVTSRATPGGTTLLVASRGRAVHKPGRGRARSLRVAPALRRCPVMLSNEPVPQMEALARTCVGVRFVCASLMCLLLP